MPRDGSGTYSQPFPPVTEGTTIESTVYNGYTADVSIDLNSPRPISTGGTGANNAADAMSNLGGEGSKIEVLNYDSHNFTAGSFYSKSSATNPPVSGHAFTGICYVAVVSGVATSDMFVEVRDRDEPTQPGSLYVRQKKAGTWSGWQKAAGTTMGATPPAAPSDGVLWWDPTRGKLFIFYADPDTSQWVECVATPDMNPDDFIRIDTDQTLTEAQKAQGRENVYAAPFDALAYNGMQINGSMEVSQEAPTATVPTGSQSKYFVDGWLIEKTGTSVLNAGQISGGPTGFRNSLQFSATTAQASIGSDYVRFMTRIEGYRISRLALGTASASPFTISFWARMFLTGTYRACALGADASANTGWFPFTINASMVWQYITIAIPAQTAGLWADSNGIGMTVLIEVASSATPNIVGATGQNAAITGLVVLPGIEAPSAARSPLIMRPYDQELLTCQRYFQHVTVAFDYMATTSNIVGVCAVTYVPYMRAVPVLTPFPSATTGTTGSPVVFGTPSNRILYMQVASGAAGRVYWYGYQQVDARL